MITKYTTTNKMYYDDLFSAANSLLDAIMEIKKKNDNEQVISNNPNDPLAVTLNDKEIKINTTENEGYQIFFDNVDYFVSKDAYEEVTDTSTGIKVTDYDDEYTDGNQFFEIDNLSDYFNVIGTLSKIHPRFARLPVDEELFKININNDRTIVRPSGNQVYAVIGDHAAETIYFIIDRYYDVVDLGDDSINAVVQVSCQNAAGEEKHYIFPTTKKDKDSHPGEIIFGWTLGKLITEKVGNITFSVRFWNISQGTGGNTDILNFSLGTQPITLNIANSLNYTSKNAILDESTEIFIKNYEKTGAIMVPTPTFEINMKSSPATGDIYITGALNDSNNVLTVKASAGAAATTYTFYRNGIKDGETLSGVTYVRQEVTQDNFYDQPVFIQEGVNKYKRATQFVADTDYYVIQPNEQTYTMRQDGCYICNVDARLGRYSSSSTSRSVYVYGPSDVSWTNIEQSNSSSGTTIDELATIYIVDYDDNKYKLPATLSSNNIFNATKMLTASQDDNNHLNVGTLSLITVNEGTDENIDFNNLQFEENNNLLTLQVYGKNELNGASTKTTASKTYKFCKPMNTITIGDLTIENKKITAVPCTYGHDTGYAKDSNNRTYSIYTFGDASNYIVQNQTLSQLSTHTLTDGAYTLIVKETILSDSNTEISFLSAPKTFVID